MVTTTLRSIELRCPTCGHEFTSQAMPVTDPPTPAMHTYTDFRTEMNGFEPLLYGVHQCGRCGFAGREDGFPSCGEASYEVQRHVWDELTPRVLGGSPTMSEKYECAAKVATWDCADPLNIADLWLRAAWCCIDEGDIEAERFYRRHAAWSFEEGLETYDHVRPGERAKIAYLIGELWRRIGHEPLAAMWFSRVPDEASGPNDEIWVHWAERQHGNPSDLFV